MIDRDSWQTPSYIFNWLNHKFKFTVDMAASDSNHLCEKYYTKENSALDADFDGEVVFCNPPYSRGMKEQFLKKAEDECFNNRSIFVFVLPALPSEGWFPTMCSEIIFIEGRIGFINPATGKEVGSPPSGTCVIVFDPFSLSVKPNTRWISKKYIKSQYTDKIKA